MIQDCGTSWRKLLVTCIKPGQAHVYDNDDDDKDYDNGNDNSDHDKRLICSKTGALFIPEQGAVGK